MGRQKDSRPQRAAIYARISDDREGRGLGVARQEADCRQLAEQLGWTVERAYTDNDLSAYRGKHRPGYEALLAAIKAGDVDGLLVWHNDRLHRHQRELEDFIELVELTAIPIETVTAGAYDLTTASGRMTSRILGAVARQESEHKAERQKAKHAELREKGAPNGGARPFGLTEVLRRPDGSGYRELVPAEAEAIRQAAKNIINGASIRSCCRRFDEDGLLTTLGHKWQPIVLTRLLTSEGVVGRRGGKPAQWPSILSDETQKLVKALLASRARGHGYPRTLLAGIAVCGLCGHGLVSRPKSDRRPCYVCAKDTGGCGGVRVLAADLEQDVLGRLFSRLDAGQLADARTDDPMAEATAELARLENIRVQLAEMAGRGELALDEFRTAKAANDAAIRQVTARLSQSAEPEVVRRTRAEAFDLRTRWDQLGIEDKRRLVAALAQRIELHPAVRGRNYYEPARVKVRLR